MIYHSEHRGNSHVSLLFCMLDRLCVVSYEDEVGKKKIIDKEEVPEFVVVETSVSCISAKPVPVKETSAVSKETKKLTNQNCSA